MKRSAVIAETSTALNLFQVGTEKTRGVLHDETPFAMPTRLAFMAAFTLPLERIESKLVMLSQPLALARTPAFVSKQLCAMLMSSVSPNIRMAQSGGLGRYSFSFFTLAPAALRATAAPFSR